MSASMLNFDRIPTLYHTDVLVIGSGSAGCCAALAARLSGRRDVTLVERYGFLGGTSTQVLDTFYGFFTPGEPSRKVVGGIPDQVVDLLDAQGAAFLRPNTYGAGTGVTYNPERLKYVWDCLMEEAGVRVLFHATLVDVEASPSGELNSAIFWAKQGFFRVRARRFIDASGDADLCHWAGISYEKAGDIDPAQTLTTTFRMSNVDLDQYEAAGGKRLLSDQMEAALEKGTHDLPRKAGSLHRMSQEGCISTVAVRISEVDATRLEELGAAEREGRRQAFVYEQFFKDCIPGFARASIIGLAHHIGVRETRRVYGEYRLTREDCLSATQFEDQVLICGAPIEDHREAGPGEAETRWEYIPGGGSYGVPYRALVPRGRDEVWVVGRCFSATHDAHASCRSMGQTMSMGQAAGLAADLSLQGDGGARDVSINKLQENLLETGAVLEMPSAPACTKTDAWKENRTPKK